MSRCPHNLTFLLTAGLAGLILLLSGVAVAMEPALKLLPWPQHLDYLTGEVRLGPPEIAPDSSKSPKAALALDYLVRALPTSGPVLPVRLGCLDEGTGNQWLQPDEAAFLKAAETSEEAYVLRLDASGATLVGKSAQGLLWAAQTLVQIAKSVDERAPALAIRDWPTLEWRCLSPTMTWYSGWNRLEGYDLCNWTLDEWKWLVDWSVEQKINCWAMCLYGFWPFTLEGFEESVLDVESFFFDPATEQKTAYQFVHRNIKREFLPELLAYAEERGVKVYAYIGKNSFNGGYIIRHPEANAGGAAEALPFEPGVAEYWDAFIGRLLECGFDGFVFEDPEAYHVPNGNLGCWETFWKPWAEEYGYSSPAETDANKPPLGVHVEYYTWLFRQFDKSIQRHAKRLGKEPELYLISHFLLSRILGEAGSEEKAQEWLRLVDEKQGHPVKYIVAEGTEPRFVDLLGPDRVASLGGRGGSCLCAWRRMTGVNSNAVGGPMGASVDWERDCQRRVARAGGFGAMAYTFEWRSNEIYGYIGAQHLWNPVGVPGLNNEDQVGFLDWACRIHYGDKVGALVAKALDSSANVNDAMVLVEIHGSQYPETGRALHRDYQLLAAQADEVLALAFEAYRDFTGREPNLEAPDYQPEAFHWAGPDAIQDKLFKAESLRWLCVELKRAQVLCEAALAHRKAASLAAQGATPEQVIPLLEQCVELARANQRLYQLNFDDDYNWNDGLSVNLTERFEALLALAKPQPSVEMLISELGPADPLPWEKLTDMLPTPDAGPGLRLKAKLGLNSLRSYQCHGVVYSVLAEVAGDWRLLFRRTIGKNATDWEEWDIPLPAGTTAVRLLTDSYTRAQARASLPFDWALWGDVELVRVGAEGDRILVAHLIDSLDKVQRFVVMDSDGLVRSFDGSEVDSTGAEIRRLAPGLVQQLRAGEGADWQWVDGYTPDSQPSAPHASPYPSYAGNFSSWWGYARELGEVTWATAPVPEAKRTAFVFIGGTDYTPGTAELLVNGQRALGLTTGSSRDALWREGEVELRYFHKADTRDERITYGLSGVFVLVLPAELLQTGQPVELTVRVLTEGQSWFMLHGIEQPLAKADGVTPPPGADAVFTAFTPRAEGKWGLTGLEWELPNSLGLSLH